MTEVHVSPLPARISPLVGIAVLAPMLLATAITVLFAIGERAGRTPLSYQRPANVAEAAGMGIAAEVLRFVRAGEDVQRLYPVRADIISANVTQVTALEAAIWSRRVELVRLLDREGLLPASERPHLACLASAIQIESIVAYLRGTGGDSNASGSSAATSTTTNAVPCDPDATYRAIEARGR